MNDKSKTKADLIFELEALRKKISLLDGKINETDNHKNVGDTFYDNNSLTLVQQISAVESSIDGIAILNENKQYLYVNNSYVKIFGYENKSDIIGKNCDLIYATSEYSRFHKIVLSELDQCGKWRGEAIGLKKDGSNFFIENSLTKIDNNNIICVIRDVSERKKIESIIEESEQRYRSLFENSPVSIVIINADNGKIIDYNKRAYKALDYSNNRFQELYIFDIQILESPNFILNQLQQIITTGSDQFETNFQTRTGDLRNMKINAKVVTLTGKKYVEYLCNDITEQKQKNFQLIESETRYRALVEKSHDAIFIYKNKHFIYHNKRTSELTGYSVEELSEINPLDIFHTEGKPDFNEIFKDILHITKSNPLLETRLLTKEGKILNVEVSISVIPHQGSLAALFTVRNITERRQLEKAYKLIVDNSLQGLVIYQNYRIVFANKKASEISGYSIDELMSFDDDLTFKMIFPDDRKIAKKVMRARVLSYDPPKSYRHRIIRKNGDISWVEVVASRIDFEGIPAVQAAYVDITESKLAEEALLESEERYKTLVENAFDSIYLLKGKHFQYVNPKFCEVTGYSFKELTHKDFEILDLLTDDSKKIFTRRFKAREQGKELPSQYQMQIFNKNGQIVHVELSTAQIGTRDNLHILGIMRDITQRKKVEEEMKDLIIALHISKDLTEERAKEIEDLNNQLRESEAHLQELNNSKDKFFSIIAHDLKGPFSGFLGLSKMLTKDLTELTLNEIQDIAKDLNDSAHQLFRLLENLLQWSRIQRKIINFEPEEINLKELTEINIALLTQNAKQKNIILVNNLDPELVAFADANMANTILRNLISNAVKFTNSGDSVTVHAKMIEDSMLEISVEDTGIGMDEEIRKKLFILDSQHTTLGTANEKGTGLGLILCKELIEINGGTISVESKVGIGTTFKFTLPYVKHQ